MSALRDYQTACLSEIHRVDLEGCINQLVALPTGCGKTRIASHVPDAIDLSPFEVMAFIVGTEELAAQAIEDLTESNPDRRITLEKAEHHGDVDADIVVASIDTLARSEDRLSRFARLPLRVIFIDECHSAIAPKYLKVLKSLRVLKGEDDRDPHRLLIGLTATPRRHDGLALEAIFDRIVFRRSIREMIAAKWIAEPIAYRVDTGLSLDGLPIRGGDFAPLDLSRTMNTPDMNALVVQKYLEYGRGLPAIAFTVDIKHSEDLAATFRHHGLEFHAISSNTPKGQRKELVQAHRDMQVTGLTSCAALLQGFDSPPATVALFARPTCSGLLYCQALGRVMRPFPSPEAAYGHTGYVKKNAVILDFVGASSKHRLYTASTLFGLHPQFDFAGKPIPKTLEHLEQLQEQNHTLDISAYASLSDVEAAAVSVNLWTPAPIPKMARSCSQFCWVADGPDRFRLSAPGLAIYIEQDHLGKYEVYRRADKCEPDGHMTFTEPEDSFSYADSLVPDEFVPLIRANARWRKATPSEAQAVLLWRRDPIVRKQFSSGEAFYRFACYQVEKGNAAFSRGAISLRIDIAKRAKEKAATK